MSKPKPIDPYGPQHHGKTLWCVYGHECVPSMICCKLVAYTAEHAVLPAGVPGEIVCLWGYSVYKRVPGFRTIGKEIETWQRDGHYSMVEFYDDHDAALGRMRALTTPKAGA